MFRKFALILILALSLIGCGIPDKQRVSKDFKEIFAREVGTGASPIIVSIGSGEGDSENVYERVEFDVVGEKDLNLKEGWLNGLSLRKGQILKGGEVVILYQKKDNSGWTIHRYDLTHSPK